MTTVHKGASRQAAPVTDVERRQWAHDRMMAAIQRAAYHREDRALTTAAFARAKEYQAILDTMSAAADRRRLAAAHDARKARRQSLTETSP